MRTSSTRLAAGIVTATLALASTGFAAGAEPQSPTEIDRLLELARNRHWSGPESDAFVSRVHGRRDLVDAVLKKLAEDRWGVTLEPAVALLDGVGVAALDAIPAVMAVADREDYLWFRKGGQTPPDNRLLGIAREIAADGDAVALATVQEYLEYPQLGVRRWALNALEVIGPGARDCEPTLLAMLQRTPVTGIDEGDYDHTQILEAIAAVCPRETSMPLLVAALKHATTGPAAVAQLVKIGAAAELADLLAHGDPALHGLAAEQLAYTTWTDSRLAPALRDHCHSDDVDLRTKAALALWHHQPGAPDAVDVLRKEILSPSDDSRLAYLFWQIGAGAAPALPEIRYALGDRRLAAHQRRQLIVELEHIGPARLALLPRLLAIAADHAEDETVRSSAIYELCSWHKSLPPTQQALLVDVFRAALDDGNDVVLASAARMLHFLDPANPEPLARLIARLETSETRNDPVTVALLTAWDHGVEAAIPALIRNYRITNGVGYARNVLVKIGAPAIPALREAAEDDDPRLATKFAAMITAIERKAEIQRVKQAAAQADAAKP